MSLDNSVTALTAQLKTDFWRRWSGVAKPAPVDKVLETVPSTTRIENYLQQTPVPQFKRWMGERQYQQTDTFVFQVRNEVWDNEISCTLDNIEDDQTGITLKQPAILVKKGKIFPGRMAFKLMGQAIGATIALQGVTPVGNLNSLVDNLPFFGSRPVGGTGFGSGNNLISFVAPSNDGLQYNLVALYFGNEEIKPLCWQQRSGPSFETNAGTQESKENREVRWWVDLRGAPFFGYWYSAVGVQITNTPTVADMHAIYSAIDGAFSGMAYPRSSSTEDGEYIHEQEEFDSSNIMYVGSTRLRMQLKQSLGQDWSPQNIGANSVATTNLWQKAGLFCCSRFLDMF